MYTAEECAVPPFKEFAIGVAMRSGMILMRNFHDAIKTAARKKSRREVVCDSDCEVDAYIRYKVQEQYPRHNFISEEGKTVDKGSRYTWVVDPLDGTLNYTIGNPFFTVSITVLEDNEPIIGVIYAPYMGEMFVAERRRSARLNERNMRVSDERKLSDSVVSLSYFPRDKKARSKFMKMGARIEDHARSIRHLGCTSLELAYIACGRLEGQIIAPPLRMWDIAAGMLLVQVAGGRVTNFDGKAWAGVRQGFVASNGKIHNQLLKLVS
jgi:myo-inositol-1(or 4)-monophosphatase